MKRLALFFGMVGMLAVVQTPLTALCATNDIATAGKAFVGLLVRNDFAGAAARFDGVMKATMPEPKLRETWRALEAPAGSFQQQLQAGVRKSDGYDIALVSCQFERGTLQVKVVFDPKRQVAGLFFEFSPLYVAPSYVSTNALREIEFTVGRGKRPLPGTLTLPRDGKKPWPAVVLVHGSGPADRDATLGCIRPFRDLAWGLGTKGIAVLRYEKRTRQYPIRDYWKQGLGQFTVREETIDDALSAVAQLRATEGIDPQCIFVLGHSMGGLVAPRIGQADPQIAGLIFLAGAVRPFEEVIVEQTRYLISLNGKPSAESAAYLAQVELDADKLKKLTAADASSPTILFGAPVAYWLDMRAYDPLAAAREIRQPMLFLQGGRDYQVTEKDFEIWKTALSTHPGVTFKLYPQLNHRFVAGTGKSTPAECELPGHVEGQAVADIAEWITKYQKP